MDDSTAQRGALRALEESWKHEMEAAATYRLLVQQEKDPRRRDVLQKLIRAEEAHAARWAARIRELGGEVPDAASVKPGLGLTLQVASPEVVYRKLEAMEARGLAAEKGVAASLDPTSRASWRKSPPTIANMRRFSGCSGGRRARAALWTSS